jgi:hypothetical protein
MPETSYAMLGNPVRTAESVRMEMACIVRLAAEPVRPDDHIGALIRRAATRLGLNYSRAKRLWYSEVSVIPAHEADALRERRMHLLRDRAARLNNELQALQIRLADLET